MYNFTPYSITLRGSIVNINEPWVMGILNLTPDSFYGNSRCNESDKIEKRVIQIIQEGAKIIDIGGYSSRPGAIDISLEEEYSRLAKGLDIIKRVAPDALISVDTFRSEIVRRCVNEWGIDIINDISGGNLDCNMFSTVASLGIPYILMHMRGTPVSMSQFTQYNDVTIDVIDELTQKTKVLEEKGVQNIIIDPGFGFSKTLNQNFEMMKNLDAFHKLHKPILVGISRKSMIYRTLEGYPETTLNGTTVLNTIALTKGAHILRVHDVKEAVEAIKLINKTTKS